jgi:co-chaperonin GroES (HSP10)
MTEDNTSAFKEAEKFTPFFDRVLIKRELSALERRLKTSGLQLADNAKDNHKSSEGILIKCAADCDDRIKKLTGKRVLFARYSGDDIKVGDQEYVLATDIDIFGELHE